MRRTENPAKQGLPVNEKTSRVSGRRAARGGGVFEWSGRKAAKNDFIEHFRPWWIAKIHMEVEQRASQDNIGMYRV